MQYIIQRIRNIFFGLLYKIASINKNDKTMSLVRKYKLPFLEKRDTIFELSKWQFSYSEQLKRVAVNFVSQNNMAFSYVILQIFRNSQSK